MIIRTLTDNELIRMAENLPVTRELVIELANRLDKYMAMFGPRLAPTDNLNGK